MDDIDDNIFFADCQVVGVIEISHVTTYTNSWILL